jgi:hypothetical protein
MQIHRLQLLNNHYWSLLQHDQQPKNHNNSRYLPAFNNRLFPNSQNLHCKFIQLYQLTQSIYFFFLQEMVLTNQLALTDSKNPFKKVNNKLNKHLQPLKEVSVIKLEKKHQN